jgi:hypothetical protein
MTGDDAVTSSYCFLGQARVYDYATGSGAGKLAAVLRISNEAELARAG